MLLHPLRKAARDLARTARFRVEPFPPRSRPTPPTTGSTKANFHRCFISPYTNFVFGATSTTSAKRHNNHGKLGGRNARNCGNSPCVFEAEHVKLPEGLRPSVGYFPSQSVQLNHARRNTARKDKKAGARQKVEKKWTHQSRRDMAAMMGIGSSWRKGRAAKSKEAHSQDRRQHLHAPNRDDKLGVQAFAQLQHKWCTLAYQVASQKTWFQLVGDVLHVLFESEKHEKMKLHHSYQILTRHKSF